MHLTPNGFVSPINRDYTSIFMKIKGCIKLIQNARILSCMLHFWIGLRRALGRDLLFLRQVLTLIFNLPFQHQHNKVLTHVGIIMNPADPAASRSKSKNRNHCSGTAVFLSEIDFCTEGTIKIDYFHNNPLMFFKIWLESSQLNDFLPIIPTDIGS